MPLTPYNADLAWDFVEHWCGERNPEEGINDSLLCEREAIATALDNMGYLGFKGLMVRVDGRVVAMTFGDMVNEETVLIHVEKAFSEYRGLYSADQSGISQLLLAGRCLCQPRRGPWALKGCVMQR